jgi:acylphosphatase
MPSEKVSAEIVVDGRVQGVGYRFFTERAAAAHDIKGWSMNLPDGRVMLEVEGSRDDVEKFINELEKGPPMSRVTGVNVKWKPFQDEFSGFRIKF